MGKMGGFGGMSFGGGMFGGHSARPNNPLYRQPLYRSNPYTEPGNYSNSEIFKNVKKWIFFIFEK